ncbi:MAG: hypothetical protein E6Q50_10725 [Lysobacter sp.]|nr:MAG: hypothetical protein E6Q50_10725 [Lysobacter sp.]
MKNLQECVDFVKTQVTFHERKAAYFERGLARYPANQKRMEAHREMAAKFSELWAFLMAMHIDGTAAPSRNVRPLRLGLTPEEIDGLPAELLEELSISEADKADFAVLSVIDEAGGVLSLDKILIALYRKTGEINKRTQLNSRIYRMMQKGMVYSVNGRKGVYSTRELTEAEVESLS